MDTNQDTNTNSAPSEPPPPTLKSTPSNIDPSKVKPIDWNRSDIVIEEFDGDYGS